MSKKVIDVAVWNAVINYKAIKTAGVEGAIVKVINKKGNADGRLETHLFGFREADIPIVGGYNYSYATSAQQGREDAKQVIAAAKGRISNIYLDVEDEVQKGLGKELVEIILEYQKEIQGAGLEFGVYTGYSFYQTYLKPYAAFLPVDFWIARYPTSAAATVLGFPELNKQPQVHSRLLGWQYSDKGIVDGISGYTDLNIWYDAVWKVKPGKVVENPYQEPVRIRKLTAPPQIGNDVKWIQFHLVRKGFLPAINKKKKSMIDGVFGKETDIGVKKAQAAFGIMVDGQCGAVTKSLLKQP